MVLPIGFLCGRLAAVRGGGSAGVPEGRLLARDSRGGGGGSGLLGGLGHPERVATLDHLLRCVEGPRIDQIADVAMQFAEEKGGLCIVAGCRAVRLSHRTEGLVSPHMG
jgi:hypothetical protein